LKSTHPKWHRTFNGLGQLTVTEAPDGGDKSSDCIDVLWEALGHDIHFANEWKY
jgi:hypothetical protein